MDWVLFVLVGFATSFVGTLAGGGGLIGMPVLLMIGVPIHQAIAAAKFSNTISSFSSFFVLFRQQSIRWKQLLLIIPISLGGGATGGVIASLLSERTMTIIAIILLMFAPCLQVFKKQPEHAAAAPSLPKTLYPILYGISVYDGMFGPGQATMLMYAYLRTGMDYLSAIAFTRFQTFISCFGALTSYLYNGHINWHIAPFLAIGSFIGAQLSVRVAQKLKQKQLQFLLHTITFLLIVQLIFNMIYGNH
ncbi:sulfite exporter TauE/SafE family protein [Parageobacillus sp. VR-IP]|uniref:sulfite exporter TauE/SafE family protein n=1 Tax=Parageobacillus sp. VR-IP TaxID=2742205 RepID=UPI001584210A|nr:sulfite exporter TauE/SafE family protein [Parageobacillus sp. VR-IP]NUK28951.1 sulfite exporter TauE/SafE family protein [Parageobacillus sp. VR-IP]